MRPRGFLRSTTEKKSKQNRNKNLPYGTPSAERSNSGDMSGATTGGCSANTGLSVTADMARLVNSEIAHTSSTSSMAGWNRSGNVSSSQAHCAIV